MWWTVAVIVAARTKGIKKMCKLWFKDWVQHEEKAVLRTLCQIIDWCLNNCPINVILTAFINLKPHKAFASLLASQLLVLLWNHCLWLDCAHASVTWCNHILSHICVSFMAPCFNNLLLVSTFSMTQRKRNAFVVRINIALWGQLSVNKACCWQGDGGQEWTIRVSAGDLQGYITRRGLREAPNLSGDLGSSTAFRIMICIMKHQSTLRESLRG